MSLDTNAELPVVDVGESIGQSQKTDVAELGKELVLKEDKSVSALTPRLEGESNSDYSQRRLIACLDFIRGQLADEQKAKNVLPDNIVAPEEHHFIAAGEDGFATPYRIQSRVVGRPINEAGDIGLTEDQNVQATALLRASMEAFRTNGARLDLVGISQGDKRGVLACVGKYLDPIGNSRNLLITKDGKIALVDVKLARGPLHVQAATFLLTALAYWRRRARALSSSNR